MNLTLQQVGTLAARVVLETTRRPARERAETQWNNKDALNKDSKPPDVKVTSSLTFKDQVLNAWNCSGLVNSSKEMSKWNTNEVTSFTRFEDQAARAVQRVFLPGTFYGHNERVAITLGADERNQAVVPLNKIPADSLQTHRNYIQSLAPWDLDLNEPAQSA